MLWDSIRKNSAHNVNVIFSANFPVDAPLNSIGMNSLHFACCSASESLILEILKFTPNLNARDNVIKVCK